MSLFCFDDPIDIAKANLDATKQALDEAERTSADPATIKALKDKVAAASLAVTTARIGLESAKRSVRETRNMDLPAGDESTQPIQTVRSVPGPVLYRIVENAQTGGIALEPVNFKLFSMSKGSKVIPSPQLNFETWGKKPPPDTSGGSGGSQSKLPDMTKPKGGNIVVNKFKADFSQILEFDSEIRKMNRDPIVKDVGQADQSKYLKKVDLSGKSATLTWDKDMPNGTYTVSLSIWFKNNLTNEFALTLEVK